MERERAASSVTHLVEVSGTWAWSFFFCTARSEICETASNDKSKAAEESPESVRPSQNFLSLEQLTPKLISSCLRTYFVSIGHCNHHLNSGTTVRRTSPNESMSGAVFLKFLALCLALRSSLLAAGMDQQQDHASAAPETGNKGYGKDGGKSGSSKGVVPPPPPAAADKKGKGKGGKNVPSPPPSAGKTAASGKGVPAAGPSVLLGSAEVLLDVAKLNPITTPQNRSLKVVLLQDVSPLIDAAVSTRSSKSLRSGVLHLYFPGGGLTMNENNDPTVRTDMLEGLRRIGERAAEEIRYDVC